MVLGYGLYTSRATAIWQYRSKLGYYYEIIKYEGGRNLFFVRANPFMDAHGGRNSFAKQYYKAMLILMNYHPIWRLHFKETIKALKDFYKINDSKIASVKVKYTPEMTEIGGVSFWTVEKFLEPLSREYMQYLKRDEPFIIASANKCYPDELVDAENKYFQKEYNVDLWHLNLDELPKKLLNKPTDLKQLKALIEIMPIAKKIKEETEGIDDPKKKKQIKTLYHKKIDKAREGLKKKSSTNKNKSDKEFDYNYIAKKIEEINKIRKNRLSKVMRKKFGLNGSPITEGQLYKKTNSSNDKKIDIEENSYIFFISPQHPLFNIFQKIQYYKNKNIFKEAEQPYIDLIKFFDYDNWTSQDSVFVYLGHSTESSSYVYMIGTGEPNKPKSKFYDWSISSFESAKKIQFPIDKDIFYLEILFTLGVDTKPFLEKCLHLKDEEEPFILSQYEKNANSKEGYKKLFQETIKKLEEKKANPDEYFKPHILAFDLDEHNRPILIYIEKIPTEIKAQKWVQDTLKQLGFSFENGKWIYRIPDHIKNLEEFFDDIKDILFHLNKMKENIEKNVLQNIDKIEDIKQFNYELDKIELLNNRDICLLPYLEKAKTKGSNIFKTPADILYNAYINKYPEEKKLMDEGSLLDDLFVLIVDMDSDGKPLLIIGLGAELYPFKEDTKKGEAIWKAKVYFVEIELDYDKENGLWVKRIEPKDLNDFWNKVFSNAVELQRHRVHTEVIDLPWADPWEVNYRAYII